MYGRGKREFFKLYFKVAYWVAVCVFILTGFWIESSLMVSPKEQVEVMKRIFGENSDYSEETQNELKQVMLVPEHDRADISIQIVSDYYGR